MNVTTKLPSSNGTCTRYVMRHRDFTQLYGVTGAFVAVYLLVMFLSVSGNLMVIWTVWRHKYMHTVTNYYLVNLATSDLLVSALVLPLKLLEYTAPCDWQVFHSDMLCAFQYYLLPIFVFASVLTLVAISLERYYAIVHPLASMKIHSKSRTRKILAITWLVPMVLASPYIFCRSYSVTVISEFGYFSRQICTDRFDDIDVTFYGPSAKGSGRFRRGYFLFLFFVIYLIPMLVIVITCCRIVPSLLQPLTISHHGVGNQATAWHKQEESKRKVAKMIIVVSVAFIVFWSPQYLVSIISQLQHFSFLRKENFFFTMLLTHVLGFFNSCLNPFIYAAMSERFRRHFRLIVLAPCFTVHDYGTYQFFKCRLPGGFVFAKSSHGHATPGTTQQQNQAMPTSAGNPLIKINVHQDGT